MRMHSIGFTGTQQGMSNAQLETLRKLLDSVDAISGQEFHHGDCIGADAQAFQIAKQLDYVTVCHPPLNPSKRAFTQNSRQLPVKPYLDRNRDIVDASEMLIATPKGMQEELRSGTWATIRYACRQRKPIQIIWPDGTVTHA